LYRVLRVNNINLHVHLDFRLILICLDLRLSKIIRV
jgi:hypothetical protein